MCGIAGFVGTPEKWGTSPRLVLEQMVAAIRHRGPDGWGLHVDGRAGLAHARLSVIDLAGGGQPMADECGSVWITYNGEVFNYLELKKELARDGYHFRTSSDTEVVLQAYRRNGPDCVAELNGDFAFAIWDPGQDRLVLARDRMGVRPVYYAITDGVLVFGSEVKALLRVPGIRAEIDPAALSQCFTFWFPLAPRTVFKGIQELPPGHVLVAGGGHISVKAYWRPCYPSRDDPRPEPRSEEDLAEELRGLLTDATRLRLRADVPVGAYLSGGLDSSSVTALMKRLAPDRLKTFSVRFEEAEFDEGPHQHQVAESLGCEHESVLVRAREIGCLFPEVVRHVERPIIRTAPAPLLRLAGLVRRNGFKVVLTGEGADEIFGGYDLFKEAMIRRFWARQPHSVRRPLLLRRLYPYLTSLRQQPRAYLEAFSRWAWTGPTTPSCRTCRAGRLRAAFSASCLMTSWNP